MLISVMMITLLERRWMGIVQRRIGRNINARYGMLQRVWDGLKLYIKERLLRVLLLSIVYLITRLVFLMIGLIITTLVRLRGTNVVIIENRYSILVILILSSMSGYSIFYSGYGSNNIYSIIGSIRCISQLISYEVYVGLMYIIILYGISEVTRESISSMCLIKRLQLEHWLFISTRGIWIIYIITIISECNRSRFDISESESELVSGWSTEYGGINFASFMIGEYTNIIIMSYISSIIFTGGMWWIIIIIIFIHVRCTFCRLRQDTLLSLGWKYILPFILLEWYRM